MALAAVKWMISSRTILKHLFPIQNRASYCVCHKSTYSPLPDGYPPANPAPITLIPVKRVRRPLWARWGMENRSEVEGDRQAVSKLLRGDCYRQPLSATGPSLFLALAP
uniref:Uncharacterized protein n=1 Tax=Catagonus wagneri TaxID=51154 RepID=A0A8C3WYE4_9CETA